MSIDNMDIAIVIFNACIIIIGYSLGTYLTKHMSYCVSVLTFTISRQLLAIIQKKCDNQAIPTFIFAILVMMPFIYNNKLVESLSNISINCFSLAWSGVIELWISSFTSHAEPFLVYIVIFISLESIHHTAITIFDFSEGMFTWESASRLYNYELMVIAHDSSSSVGLPPIQNLLQ
jgi:hypothetical protein